MRRRTKGEEAGHSNTGDGASWLEEHGYGFVFVDGASR